MLHEPGDKPLSIRPSTQPRTSSALISHTGLPTWSKKRRISSRYALRVFSARLVIVICSSARSRAAEIVSSAFMVMVTSIPAIVRIRDIRTRATNMERISPTQGGNGKSDLSLPMQVKGSITTRQAGNRPTNKGTTAPSRNCCEAASFYVDNLVQDIIDTPAQWNSCRPASTARSSHSGSGMSAPRPPRSMSRRHRQ